MSTAMSHTPINKTQLQCGTRCLDLSQPVVMGILNVTPDSFSDGGRFLSRDAALAHARKLVADGAAMIDVGAESTRPGAAAITEQEELDRTLPVLEAIAAELDVVISVDTSSPQVMREAARRGAGFINDVRALRREGALAAAAETGLPVCLMHMQGSPATMQQQPQYADIFATLNDFFSERIAACAAAGIDERRVIVDPGFGFGKTLEHNVVLLKNLDFLAAFNRPVLVGLSRKSMLGALLGGAPVQERLHAGIAAAAIAVMHGARIVRVHDVKETQDALRVAAALLNVKT